MTPTRIIAVDWSGSLTAERTAIVLAEVDGRGLIRVESGRTREQVAEHLIREAAGAGRLVIGLDFAFSFPAWYAQERGWLIAPDGWQEMAGGYAEAILARDGCRPPFWGRPGTTKPRGVELFRRTERGCGAKSVFQIGGAGAVGTGSLRGMTLLHRLHEAGRAIWPMASPCERGTVVEIYPRVLTGPVNKSDPRARREYLGRLAEGELNGFAEIAAASEDAFDAAVSALVMWRHRERFGRLRRATDQGTRIEGAIWHPASVDGTEPTPRTV